jgi:hypothetical protein
MIRGQSSAPIAPASEKIPERRVNSTPDECVNCASALMTDTYLDAEKLQEVALLVGAIQNFTLYRPQMRASGCLGQVKTCRPRHAWFPLFL